jgi:hypothetical protein
MFYIVQTSADGKSILSCTKSLRRQTSKANVQYQWQTGTLLLLTHIYMQLKNEALILTDDNIKNIKEVNSDV